MLSPWVRNQVKIVTREMVEDRGFTSVQFAANESETVGAFERGGVILRSKKKDGMECSVLIYCDKVGVKSIRDIEETYYKDKSSQLIIISLKDITAPAQKRFFLPEIISWCSIFPLGSVIRNVTRHEWVPKHTKLTDEEVKGVLERWKLDKITKLPIILTTDVVSRYLGLQEGDVVEISGPDGTNGGTGIQYRRVATPTS